MSFNDSITIFFCCFLWLNGLELKNYDLVVAPRQAIVMQFRGSMTSGSLSVGEARDALDLRNVENRVLRRLDFIQRYNNCSDIITITNRAWRSRHTKKRTNQISKFNSNFCTRNEFFGFESCFSRLVNVYKLELNAKWNFQQGINHNIKLCRQAQKERKIIIVIMTLASLWPFVMKLSARFALCKPKLSFSVEPCILLATNFSVILRRPPIEIFLFTPNGSKYFFTAALRNSRRGLQSKVRTKKLSLLNYKHDQRHRSRKFSQYLRIDRMGNISRFLLPCTRLRLASTNYLLSGAFRRTT